MGALIFYSFTRVIAFMASLATLTVLVIFGHPYWAFLPAILAVILGLACAFNLTGNNDEKDPTKIG